MPIAKPALFVALIAILMTIQSGFASTSRYYVAYCAVGAIAALVIGGYGLYRNSMTRYIVTWQRKCLALLGGLAYSVVGILINTAMTQTGAESATSIQPTARMMVYVVLLAPLMEEAIFRQVLYQDWLAKWPSIGMLIAGAIFVLLHFPTSPAQWIFYILSTAGIFATYIWSGRDLRMVIILHMLINMHGIM